MMGMSIPPKVPLVRTKRARVQRSPWNFGLRPWLALLLFAIPALAQVTASSGAVPCSVRIRPIAAADYDPASEFTLQGTVIAVLDGALKLRLPFGVIRVQVGQALRHGTLAVGETIEVLASRRQDDAGQRFVAREVRTASGTVVLRDAQGVPVRP